MSPRADRYIDVYSVKRSILVSIDGEALPHCEISNVDNVAVP